MITELLTALARANIAAGAAILVVLALRQPARRLFGAQQAYGLWVLAPLAALAVLLPARQGPPPSPAPTPAPIIATRLTSPPALQTPALLDVRNQAAEILAPNGKARQPLIAPSDLPALILWAWIAGAVVSVGLLVRRQRRFLAMLGRLRPMASGDSRMLLAEGSGAGPALVGMLFPRVIVPADFERRFTPAERTVVLAHEQAHLARRDARTNGVLALAQCLNWFNPLLHLGAYFIRLDQELACDAAVMATLPGQRRCYAEALLKTQLTTAPLPLGCYWPARSKHPLEERIAMLKQPSPGRGRRLAGLAVVAAVTLAGGLAAWASQPPQPSAAPPSAAPQTPVQRAAPILQIAQAAPATKTPPTVTSVTDSAAGDWTGTLNSLSLRIAVHIHKGADGAYQGDLDSPDQGAYGIAMDKVTVGDGALSFTIDKLKAKYDGKWDAAAQMWTGQWSQVGITWPLALGRGTFPPAPTIAGLDGDWDGKLTVGLRLVFHIQTGVHGTTGSMDSPDQTAYGLPLNRISRQGGHVVLTLPAAAISIAGELSGDGKTITGVFTQRGGDSPLVLTRRAPGAPPPLPPPAAGTADATDFSGAWSVVGVVQSNGQTGLARPNCTFQQAGDRLTGTCKGPGALGTATGTVSGRRITWRWDETAFTPLGASGVANFDGTLGADGVVRGSMTFSALPGATGTFTQQRP